MSKTLTLLYTRHPDLGLENNCFEYYPFQINQGFNILPGVIDNGGTAELIVKSYHFDDCCVEHIENCIKIIRKLHTFYGKYGRGNLLIAATQFKLYGFKIEYAIWDYNKDETFRHVSKSEFITAVNRDITQKR